MVELMAGRAAMVWLSTGQNWVIGRYEVGRAGRLMPWFRACDRTHPETPSWTPEVDLRGPP